MFYNKDASLKPKMLVMELRVATGLPAVYSRTVIVIIRRTHGAQKGPENHEKRDEERVF